MATGKLRHLVPQRAFRSVGLARDDGSYSAGAMLGDEMPSQALEDGRIADETAPEHNSGENSQLHSEGVALGCEEFSYLSPTARRLRNFWSLAP